MKTRTRIASVGAASLLGTGAFFLPADASPHTSTHVLKFTSVQQNSLSFSKASFAQLDKDVNSANKKIGFDTLQGVFDPKTKSVKIDVAFNAKGGFMYFHLHNTDPNDTSFAGPLTGGTGKFAHATGGLVAKDLNKEGTRTAVTITYTS
jgi:hypothetical protein